MMVKPACKFALAQMGCNMFIWHSILSMSNEICFLRKSVRTIAAREVRTSSSVHVLTYLVEEIFRDFPVRSEVLQA
jgi:hypothetical protein